MITIERNPNGDRASIKVQAGGYTFQAAYQRHSDGTFGNPAIHGSLPSELPAQLRAELERLAREEAARLRPDLEPRMLGLLTLVSPDDLIECAREAPVVTSAAPSSTFQLEAYKLRDGGESSPFAAPVLVAGSWDGEPAWVFHGTIDIAQPIGVDRYKLEPSLAAQLGAKYVHVKALWDSRPEVFAYF